MSECCVVKYYINTVSHTYYSPQVCQGNPLYSCIPLQTSQGEELLVVENYSQNYQGTMPSDCACGMGDRCLYELRKNEVVLAKEKYAMTL